jgi:thioredoxin 1
LTKVISESEFEAEVIQSPKPVLVDFFAVWCPPCRALAPVIDEISESGLIKVVKIDVDGAKGVASKYKVFSVPTLMLFNGGKSTDSRVGFASKSSLESWIKSKI